jgi:hypothetical protein
VVNCCPLDVELRAGSKVRFCRRPSEPAADVERQSGSAARNTDQHLSSGTEGETVEEQLCVYVDIKSDAGIELLHR